ncbi:hypothetical protein GDO81_007907 [Engystomops pustulosus]|uniref:Uncharacterized protein n=1 Tax=Engystomops pustulosus TaxID=76066 RepID=A0AAV7CBL1_ENGPU|nr:hypothetical protein GDO81_007907 [Engystomops pustulosus]
MIYILEISACPTYVGPTRIIHLWPHLASPTSGLRQTWYLSLERCSQEKNKSSC